MSDYHAKQFDGGATACDGRNCAAATCAMEIYAGTGGKVQLTSDQVRSRSGVSCIPGAHSPSGGLYISDVIRVAGLYGVRVDFGQGAGDIPPYRRWPASEARARLSGPYGMHVLGDYDQIPAPYRAPGSTFRGDHSAYAHDYRDDATVCWHDPLRSAPIRMPLAVLLKYWQKPGSPVKGLAGFTRLPETPPTYRVHIEAGATVRVYVIGKDTGANGNRCIAKVAFDQKWGRRPSSAPASVGVRRDTCNGLSAATTSLITAGTFKGRHIRVNAEGVTLREVIP